MSEVVRLVDSAPGFPVDGQADLVQWCKGWLDALAGEDYQPLRSLVIVAETMDGNLCSVSQSLASMDNARAVGLLMCAAHLRINGEANPEGIEAER